MTRKLVWARGVAATDGQLVVFDGAERMLSAGRRAIRATARMLPTREYGLRLRTALAQPVRRALAFVRGNRSSSE